ncbi:uncharacterized protein ACBT57_023253 isoform 7-T16 [Dama dama]
MMSGSRCCEPGGKEETWRAIVTAQCVLCHHLKGQRMDRRGKDANKETGTWPLQMEDGDQDWCAAVEITWSGQTKDVFGEVFLW